MSHLGETHPMRPSEPKGRLVCSYAEAVYALHKVESDDLFRHYQAATLAVIYSRLPETVLEDIKRGMVA